MKNFNKLYETPAIIVLPMEALDILATSDNDAAWDDNWNDSYIFS